MDSKVLEFTTKILVLKPLIVFNIKEKKKNESAKYSKPILGIKG